MGATENAGFNTEVQRNLVLDFVTKQQKSLKKNFNQFSIQLSASDKLTHVNFPTFAMAHARHGGLIRRLCRAVDGA